MMIEIPAILIYKRKIKGFGSVEELISSTSSKTLYLYDYDSFLGKDDSVELKKYKLSGGKYIIYNKDLDDRELEVAKPVFLRGVIYDRAV